MKNLSFLLLTILFLSSCQSDDASNSTFSINIDVEEGYYDVGITTLAMLTDTDDNIVSQGVLSNGSSIELTINDSLANEQFNLTLVGKIQGGWSDPDIYIANTFLDIKTTQIAFESSENINSLGLKSDIKITGTNVDYSAYQFPYFNHNLWSENNDSYTFELRNIPEDVLFTFKLEDEESPRYLLLPNLVGGENLEYDISKTDIMSTKIELDYPSNDGLISSVTGYRNNTKRRLSHLSDFGGITTTATHYLPSGIYAKYALSQTLIIEGKEYESLTISDTVLNNYAVPDLDFEIKNNNASNFIMESPSTYDYYRASFSFANTPNDAQVFWQVHGEGEELVEFAVPNLLKSFESENTFDFSISDLANYYTSISQYNGFNDYGEYINYTSNAFNLFNQVEPFTESKHLVQKN